MLLMVTRDPQDAARIAQEMIVVDEGRAAPPCEAPALFADPPAALRAYLGYRAP